MAEDKKKGAKAKRVSAKVLSFVMPPQEEEKYSILLGQHPELVGQFVRTSPGAAMCTGEAKDIGPNRVRYPYLQRWIDSRGDVRNGRS